MDLVFRNSDDGLGALLLFFAGNVLNYHDRLTTVHGTLRGTAVCEEPEDALPAGIYEILGQILEDLANHACCVPPLPDRVLVNPGSLFFTDTKLGGETRWQGLFFDPVSGSADDVLQRSHDPSDPAPGTVEIVLADDFDQTGRFVAEGVGTVAGFPNIRVRFDGVADLETQTFTGTLVKGVDGGLPTGQPIVYEITASLIAPEPIGFVEDLARAFRESDSQFLLDHLHPEVLDLYGGACVEFVEQLSSPDLTITVHSFVDVLDWELTLDGVDLVIENAVRLDVTRTEDGQADRTEMHIAPRPSDGAPTEMTWFADCGDPLPTG